MALGGLCRAAWLVSAFEIHDAELSAEACDAVDGCDDAPPEAHAAVGGTSVLADTTPIRTIRDT